MNNPVQEGMAFGLILFFGATALAMLDMPWPAATMVFLSLAVGIVRYLKVKEGNNLDQGDT